jgi:two-component system NtrC family sensor kinase
MKILVAEDDLISRKLLAKTLDRWGHEVVTASDGQEAWETFHKQDIHFLITDWMMPRMDGIELCQKIRSQYRDRLVYIILLTVRDQKEDIVVGMEAGADDFVTKPFDRNELLARIRAGERVLNLEQRLTESKKLEGIHQTAVTLQHEINNPLVGIMGNAELLIMILKDLPHDLISGDILKLETLATEILRMSKRIAAVVEKLKELYKPILTHHPVTDDLSVEMIDVKEST